MARAYFINLDRAVDRARFMEAQCAQAGVSPAHRWPAIDASRHDVSAFRRYAPHSWGHYWATSPSMVALMESHIAIWSLIATSPEPAVIFEDDALLAPSAGDVINELSRWADAFDVVKLDGAPGTARLGAVHMLGSAAVRPITHVLPSAAAYIVSAAGAKKLLAWAEAYCDSPDDFITRPSPRYRVFQVIPCVAVQGMFCDSENVPGVPSSVAGSQRTAGSEECRRNDRGPAAYRLIKDIRRTGRKIRRWLWGDTQLLRGGGMIGEVPLAWGLPPYRRHDA